MNYLIVLSLMFSHMYLNAQDYNYLFIPATTTFNESLLKSKKLEKIIHHDMKIKFDFSKNFIEVTDSFTIPDRISPSPSSCVLQKHDTKEKSTPARGEELGFSFYLHKGLNPVPVTKGVSIEPISNRETDPGVWSQESGINKQATGDKTQAENGRIFEYYYIEVKSGIKTATIKYSGKIFHTFAEQGQEHAGSFSRIPGIISEDGCYLSGTSGFYPRMAKELVTFRIEAELPKDYVIVAQGEKISDKIQGNSRKGVWIERNPQNDITISCGRFKEYSAKHKNKTFYVFLRNPDEELAKKYLEASKQYIEIYSKLLGEYPYKKFALVENFRETGYRIPSLTLLGSKAIRLPFILQSSYPHEILHNWWGNGVFTDDEKGNWSEGLTAYLSDYLIAEQQGKGKDYRMPTLRKYADFVSKSKDFSVINFNSRHSSDSEAAGYGKTMFFYHMLRQKYGDKKFIEALKNFYSINKFRYANFQDLKDSFENITDDNLDYFFDQWLTKPGAPEIELKNPSVEKIKISADATEYLLKFEIFQKQDNPYDLDVPVVLHFENENYAFRTFVNTNQKSETFEIKFSSRPLILEIDPEFDLFRKLDPPETPVPLSVMFEKNAKNLGYPERKPLIYP